jgi:hypothetical protein
MFSRSVCSRRERVPTRRPLAMEAQVKHTLFMAGVTALAFSVPAFAAPAAPLHPGIATAAAQPSTVLAQAQVLEPPPPPVTVPAPGTTVVIAPTAPPPPEAETPPPPPASTYVWDPGRWYWNGTQFAWEAGKYVQKPTITATFVPGHWEQSPDGWTWIQSQWDYPGVGSSAPPPGVEPPR